MLGTASNGYLILERGTYAFAEGGEANPYKNYMDYPQYYGGLLCYYIQREQEYLDILRGEPVDALAHMNYIDNLSETSQPDVSPYGDLENPIVHRLVNSNTYIKRVDFGYNGGDFNNTCSAIATTIALNYLDRTRNDNIVPSQYNLEALSGAFPRTTQEVISSYPKAHAFHKFLVEDCGMNAVSFAGAISIPVDTYRNHSTATINSGISVSWTLVNPAAYIKTQISNSRPAMMTTALAGQYSTHTMVVYGYRSYNNSSEIDFLVHTGWYDTIPKETGEMPDVWVPASIAVYGYSFNFN